MFEWVIHQKKCRILRLLIRFFILKQKIIMRIINRSGVLRKRSIKVIFRTVECLDAIDSMLEESSRIDFYCTQIVKYMWRLRYRAVH